MNVDSEQIAYDATIHIAQDQPLTRNEVCRVLIDKLGMQNVSEKIILDKKVFVYNNGQRKIVLLTRCITYLGNPHPIFKKRIQLPTWFQNICLECNKLGYDVRFLGIYHFEENVIFVDFAKDTYLQHGLNNSSAHVYTNDLYQAMTYGVFQKEDKFGNTIVAIRNDKLSDYLNGICESQNNLFDLFRQFNCGYPFGQWLYAFDIIREMHENNWPQWRQSEWAGWFLEYKFDKFIQEHNVQSQMRYVGSSNKGEGELDFDIRFEESDFYGDLKASDISKDETPGNDQRNLIECIYRYHKFWYIIYEHATKKDAECNYVATKARNHYIKSVDPTYDKDEMSYCSRMKHSVMFLKMTIIELNKVNFRDALKTFNQGRQPDGNARAPKFIIKKGILSNDNYVVFRYTYN